MPALARAQKVLGRAASVVEVPAQASALASEAELGDALLALVAQARVNGWDAERALRERLRLLEDDVHAAESV
jgi:XTP/dITP diphosphohydrolase